MQLLRLVPAKEQEFTVAVLSRDRHIVVPASGIFTTVGVVATVTDILPDGQCKLLFYRALLSSHFVVSGSSDRQLRTTEAFSYEGC